jgi:hypothetical protein
VQSRGQEERRRESPLNDPWVYSVPSELLLPVGRD